MTLSRKRTASPTRSFELADIERGPGGEGMLDELGKVDRAEQAGAERRQRLLAARVRGVDVSQ